MFMIIVLTAREGFVDFVVWFANPRWATVPINSWVEPTVASAQKNRVRSWWVWNCLEFEMTSLQRTLKTIVFLYFGCCSSSFHHLMPVLCELCVYGRLQLVLAWHWIGMSSCLAPPRPCRVGGAGAFRRSPRAQQGPRMAQRAQGALLAAPRRRGSPPDTTRDPKGTGWTGPLTRDRRCHRCHHLHLRMCPKISHQDWAQDWALLFPVALWKLPRCPHRHPGRSSFFMCVVYLWWSSTSEAGNWLALANLGSPIWMPSEANWLRSVAALPIFCGASLQAWRGCVSKYLCSINGPAPRSI